MGESVELEKIAAALELPVEETKELVEHLRSEYETSGHGMKIIELDGAYQMCTKSEMYEYLIRIAKQPKKHVLTDVLLETLSIIAYKQPVTKAEIEKIRGVSCDHAVSRLVEYNLEGWTRRVSHCCSARRRISCGASACSHWINFRP